MHLLVGDRVRIAPTGVRVSTAAVAEGTATVIVDTEIVNDENEPRVVTVTARLTSPAALSSNP